MKKIIAVVLALVMTLSLGTVAFGMDVDGHDSVRTDYSVPYSIARVGETAANVAAKALQIPSLVAGIALDLNRGIIVSRVNALGAPAYYGAEIAANVLDFAVSVSLDVTQAKFDLTSGVAAAAASGLADFLFKVEDFNDYEESESSEGKSRAKETQEAKLVNEVEAYSLELESYTRKDSKKHDDLSTLVKMAIELKEASRNIKDIASYVDFRFDMASEELDDVVNTVFNGKITDILNLLTWRKGYHYYDLEEDSGLARRLPDPTEDEVEEYITKKESLNKVAYDIMEFEEAEKVYPIYRKFSLYPVLNRINNLVGGLTLKQLLVPGAWTEVDKGKSYPDAYAKLITQLGELPKNYIMGHVFPYTPVIAIEGLSETSSYLAGLVNEIIINVADAMKDPTHFSAMNGSYPAYLVDGPLYNVPGGEVAETLFRMGYNLIARFFDGTDYTPWDGVIPSEWGKVPTPTGDKEQQTVIVNPPEAPKAEVIEAEEQNDEEETIIEDKELEDIVEEIEQNEVQEAAAVVTEAHVVKLENMVEFSAAK